MKAKARLRRRGDPIGQHPRRHACRIPGVAVPALRCSVSVALTVPSVAGHFHKLTEVREGRRQAMRGCRVQPKHCSREGTVDRELESELRGKRRGKSPIGLLRSVPW